ncbi:MAG: OmpA family protein [Candidatus Sericytochromatia bacterium]|nr:OmpA family protein [Candidatus Sericytochromatia bacterium]
MAVIILFLTLSVQNFVNVIRLIELESLVGRIDKEVLQPLRGPDAKADRGSLRLGEAVLFDFDSSVLRPEGKTRLAGIGLKLKGVLDKFGAGSVTSLQVSIEGHTDSQGSADYNLELSDKRARAVAEFWESACGLSRAKYDIIAVGRGPFRPLVSNARSERDLALNRRIEIRIYPRFDSLIEVLMGKHSSAANEAPEMPPHAPGKMIRQSPNAR